MSTRDTANTYGAVSIVNHWVLSIAVIGLLASGIVAAEVLEGPMKGAIIGTHKAVGLVAFLIMAWSVVWQLSQSDRPSALPGTPKPEAVARKAMHIALLLAVAILAVSGTVMSLFKGKAIGFFGLFTIPGQEPVPWLAGMAHETHEIAGWLLLIGVVGHVAVAIKHHFLNHDTTLARMIGKHA